MKGKSKERVLVTGGAGYSGSIIIDELLKNEYEVTCLDSLYFGQKAISIYAANPNFNFVYGDARDSRLLENLVKNHDIILPLAALVGAPACDSNPEYAETLNREAIRMINSIRSPHQRLIFPNTTSAYGGKEGRVACDETAPMEPISLYGKTKVDAAQTLKDSGKPFVELRLSTMFGMSLRMRTDLMINDFVLRAIRDGVMVIFEKDFKRDYVHVRDVARAFEHAIRNYESMRGQAYNVGLDEANLSKGELAERIRLHIPRFKIIYDEIEKDPDQRNYIVCNEKLKKTGFEYSVSLDEGIRELIKGYGILLRKDPFKNV